MTVGFFVSLFYLVGFFVVVVVLGFFVCFFCLDGCCFLCFGFHCFISLFVFKWLLEIFTRILQGSFHLMLLKS